MRPSVFVVITLATLPVAARAQESCDSARLGELVLDLFPPAVPERRAEAARALAECRSGRAVGAMAAAAKGDPATEVRAAAVEGLGVVGTPEAKEAIAQAAGDRAAPFAVRSAAMKALAELHETPVLEARLADSREDQDVRAQALLLLEKHGAPLPPETLARLANQRPAGLSAVATAILVQRKAAQELALAPAPAPVVEPAPAPIEVATAPPPAESVTETIAPAEVVVVKAADETTKAPEPAPVAVETHPEPAPVAVVEPAPEPTPEPEPAPASPPVEVATLTPTVLPTAPVAAAVDFRIMPPPAPIDGSSLAIGTSTVAGASLMSGLSMLSQQDSPGVLLLTGTAGALIGGFTSGVLWKNPTLSQSAWYLNSAVWGPLAGLTMWAGSGSQSEKLKWGSLVLGQAAGLGVGLWSANAYEWTPQQMVLADSLLLSAGLANTGVRGMLGLPFGVSKAAAIGIVPLMIGSTLAARTIDPSDKDLGLIAKGAAMAGWNGMLLSSGGFAASPLADARARGGLVAGLGLGYAAGVLASPFTEVDPARLDRAMWASLAGNAIGLGAHMAWDPGNPSRWALGTGLGGTALALAAYAYHPKLHGGPEALSMTLSGALYGAGTWLLAANAASDGAATDLQLRRTWGGALAGGTTAMIAGYVASKHFQPTAEDQWTTAAATALGAAGGLGVARLAFDGPGGADLLGVLGGAAAGFAGGAVASHLTELRAPDVGAGFAGLGWGAFLGGLAPGLGEPTFVGGRQAQGGAYLGSALLAAGSTIAAHRLHADGGQVGVPTVAGIFGLGMGTGAGLLFDRNDSKAIRIGAFTGPLAAAAASIAADRWLKLSDGLGPSAGSLATATTALGAVEGLFVAQLAARGGRAQNLDGQLVGGGLLLGASAGMAAGLAMSRRLDPPWPAYTFGAASTLLGGALGKGLADLAWKQESQVDPAAVIAGTAAGLVASGLLAKTEWTGADAAAGLSGAAFGSVIGTLVPSLHLHHYEDGRKGEGGALVGFTAGSALAMWAAHETHATGGEVAVASTAGLLGMLAGTGLGLALPVPTAGLLNARIDTTQPQRLGAVVGSLALSGAALAADGKLHLSQGLGPSAGGMGLFGTTIGSYYGYQLAGAISGPGTTTRAPGGQLAGGALFGAAGGLATALATSRAFEPEGPEYLLAGGTSFAGALLGAGVPLLVQDDHTRAESLGLTAGGLAALGVGAYAAHHTRLTGADLRASAWGGSYGFLAGLLLPTIGERQFSGSARTEGGTLVGVASGAVGAVLASHLLEAKPDEVNVAGTGGLLGLGTGLGLALAMPRFETSDGLDNRPQRVAIIAAPALLGAAAIAADREWHLSRGLGPDAGNFAMMGGLVGGFWGLLGSAAVDPEGRLANRADFTGLGGALAGASLGIGGGLLASKAGDLTQANGVVGLFSPLVGAGLGYGLSTALLSDPSRVDPLAALAGSVGTLALGAYTQHASPLEFEDWEAVPIGASAGLLVGSLAPTLTQADWPGYDRRTGGWALAGVSGGTLAAMALRHATHASDDTLGLTALGGVDGVLTGLGAGLLLDPNSSQPTRIGVTAGAVAGLALGSAVWPRQHLTLDDLPFSLAATGVGAWTGFWLPAAFGAQDSAPRMVGGLLTGLGGASMLASLAAPVVGRHPDLVENALGVDALWSVAGIGAGLLVKPDGQSGVAGMLIGGTAGLLAGGALHDAVDVGPEDAGFLTLAAAEGAWFGGLTPHLLMPGNVGPAQQAGGILAGTFGALGAAALATKAADAGPQALALTATGSAIGASMAGGLALAVPSLEGRAAVGTVLGGSALGLLGGAVANRAWNLDDSAVPKALVGGLLGASEGLAFAWAGRAQTGGAWGGAALFGAGTGTLLGLTAAAYPHFTTSELPAAVGCAAWGAWMGSFAGAWGGRDAHEVTLGGLLGANVGFAAGYGLLRGKLIEPSDLGWLSLFGGLGTLVGAGVGAPFSSKADATPVYAGLTIGPAVGMVAGALLLPKLKAMGSGGDAVELEVPHFAE